MKNLFLKLLACLLVAAMLITSSAVCLFAEPNGEEAADGDLVVEPVDIGPDEGEPTEQTTNTHTARPHNATSIREMG